jgi:hypothetical protein
MRRSQEYIKPGDILLCYMTGVKRWVGALEIVGTSDDDSRIWNVAKFPVRFQVKPLIVLEPENGVPMEKLEGQVDFYRGPEDRGKYKAFVRKSPNPFKNDKDGILLMDLLQEAQKNPVRRPVDPKQLARKPFFRAEKRKGKTTVATMVTVPEPDPPEQEEAVAEAKATTRHTEIQYNLLALGADMGFDLWVARNDRSKIWNDKILGSMPGMVAELPTQFNEATNRTIELIDVLWLKGNSIVAAFEVECTTAIYSGLLRMSDLLALQPNLEINLFLVAPDVRRDKVEQEILRPTFALKTSRSRKSAVLLGLPC